MNAIILKCPESGQFHFGEIAPDENTSLDDSSAFIHSDTLFSAIINTAAKVTSKEKVDELIDWFKTDRCKISSGFYCLNWNSGKEEKQLFFLPKPVHYNLFNSGNADFDIKAVNKVEFISKSVWEQGILPDQWLQHCIILQDKFVLLKSELPSGIEEEAFRQIDVYGYHSLPKVFVHKPSQRDSFYYQTNVVLGDNKHLHENLMVHYYFLIDHELEAENWNFLEKIIALLQYEGIGGERSVGCGSLTGVNVNPFEVELSEKNEDFGLSISLVNPDSSDLKKLEYYKVLSRGGRKVAKSTRLKTGSQLDRIKMVAEGALVKGEIKGQLPSLGETQSGISFYRNGKAFCLPIHSNTIPYDAKS